MQADPKVILHEYQNAKTLVIDNSIPAVACHDPDETTQCINLDNLIQQFVEIQNRSRLWEALRSDDLSAVNRHTDEIDGNLDSEADKPNFSKQDEEDTLTKIQLNILNNSRVYRAL